MRLMMRRFTPQALVPAGLFFIGAASLALAFTACMRWNRLSLSVMTPIGIYAFGIAFVMPYMMTAAMAPFPHIAGTASGMMGFIQMSAGLLAARLRSRRGAGHGARNDHSELRPSLACKLFWYRRSVRLRPLSHRRLRRRR